ncbi:MAG: hypothetical protein IKW91_06755 [Bacteroidaceae bacterium]|nr:hypothetical protein [Bacteroidaceae bacterium]
MKNIYIIFLSCLAFCLLQGLGALQVKADNTNWMSGISDDTFVGQLSIPGTHDAGTGHGVNNYMVVVSGSTYAVTQEKTLTEQWNSGIRAFDLRPAVDGSRLRINHGIISTKLYFDDALTTLCGLLDSHPTEMCIVIIRHETEGDDNNNTWGAKMKTLLTSSPTSSHAVNYNPMAKLGDMRGKLLILSRDNYDTNPIGGYVTGWGFSADFNNQKNGKITGVGTQGKVYIQDYYDMSASGAPATKTASIQRMLQFSSSENTDPGLWVINQTSGYSKTASIFGNTVATSDGYRENAQTQNAAAINYINTISGPTGIILMDFAGEDASNGYQVKGQALTNAIIANNAKGTPFPEFFRAMSAIVEGKEYVVTTTVNGTKYYLTTNGTLTANEIDAGIFTMQYGQSGYYGRSFYFTWTSGGSTYTFTNPNQNKGANGTFSTDNKIIPRQKDRDNVYDCQVLLLNEEGKYAIRATNAAYAEDGSWAQYAADTWWAIKSSTTTPPRAGYKKAVPEYIWELEEPSTTFNITYNVYYSGTKVAEVVVPCERGAAAALPEEYIRDFCTYTYSPKNITSATVRVTVKWQNGPFKISTATGTKNWYNLKVGRLQRYVGWEGREPYHPHAYDEASVEQYPETELYATELVRASDAYQWAFVGNPIEGFMIVNKLMGDSISLTVDGTSSSVQGTTGIKNTVLREGDARWIAHADNDGFSLSLNGQENYYINTHGGPHGYLQIWETANAKTDLGSQIIAEAVPAVSVPLMQIGDGYYNTLCLPYESVVVGAKAYILENGEEGGEDEGIYLPISSSEVDGSQALAPALKDVEDGFVLLTLVGDTVPAGTPVVLWGESETAALSYGAGFATHPSTATALTGLFLPASPANALTLQGIDNVPYFYTFDGDIIEPNRAYLKLENPSIEGLLIKFSDYEDGIRRVLPSDGTSKMIYNILGQRLSHQQKGINIVGGKKILK